LTLHVSNALELDETVNPEVKRGRKTGQGVYCEN